MKTSTKILGALTLLVPALVAIFIAWLYWPQWVGGSPEQARWTVLEAPAKAISHRVTAQRGFTVSYVDPKPLKPGMQLQQGDNVFNPGPGAVRLKTPDGDIKLVEAHDRGRYPLNWQPPTPSQRLAHMRRALADSFASTPGPAPSWRSVIAPEPAALLVLLSIGCALAFLRPSWVHKTLPLRRAVFAVLAVRSVGLFALLSMGQLLAGLSIYAGILGTNVPAPRDHWATVHAVASPLSNAVFTLGVIALVVLSFSFITGGSGRLRAKSWVWWLVGSCMAVLILVGLAAPLLPVVDTGSNTQNFLRQFERFATYGAGLLIWPWLLLLFERSLPAPSLPAVQADADTPFAWPAALAGGLLTVGLVFAQGLRNAELQPELPRRTDQELVASEARKLANAQKLACDATHVVYGVPKDLTVVKEPGCWPHQDGLAQPDAGVLQHCEALEFQVVVQKQFWPLPSAFAVEPVRTLRLSGTARPIEDLKKLLLRGPEALASNAPSDEASEIKARVFYGREGEDGILRNTRRGEMVTEDGPESGTDTPGLLQSCGWLP